MKDASEEASGREPYGSGCGNLCVRFLWSYGVVGEAALDSWVASVAEQIVADVGSGTEEPGPAVVLAQREEPLRVGVSNGDDAPYHFYVRYV